MKGKIAHFLLILNSVLLHFGTGEALFTVNGIVNGSVTLPSGSPYHSPSEVQWTIDNRIIVFYLKPSRFRTDIERFGDRLRLNATDGSLQINRAQMSDADTYTVVVSQGKSKHKAEVKLMIYEGADTPILEVLTNTSGPRFCNVSVRCATLHGLWVASLCQLTQGKLVCQETARIDSAHSAWLLITATRDAINCSSSNPASTSSAPLLPVTQVCPATVPGYPLNGQGLARFGLCTKGLRGPIILEPTLVCGKMGKLLKLLLPLSNAPNSEALHSSTQQNGTSVHHVHSLRSQVHRSPRTISLWEALLPLSPSSSSSSSSSSSLSFIKGGGYLEGLGVALSNTSTEVTVYETVTTAKPEHHLEGNTVYDTLGPVGDTPTKTATMGKLRHFDVVFENSESRKTGATK